MAELMDLISQAMGGDSTRQIGQRVGASEGSTQNAIAAALPMLLGALANNSSRPEGAEALHAALERDHDGGVLDDLGGFLGGSGSPAGDGILRHVLGDRQPQAQQAIAHTSGLDSGQAGQILAMLAPVVMGALGRTQRTRGADAAGVAGMLGSERQSLGESSPDLMALATRLLDKDGDGSITEELGGLASKLFGRR